MAMNPKMSTEYGKNGALPKALEKYQHQLGDVNNETPKVISCSSD